MFQFERVNNKRGTVDSLPERRVCRFREFLPLAKPLLGFLESGALCYVMGYLIDHGQQGKVSDY